MKNAEILATIFYDALILMAAGGVLAVVATIIEML